VLLSSDQMKCILLLLLCAWSAAGAPIDTPLTDSQTQFVAFVAEYGKSYANAAEIIRRFAVFETNLRVIAEHNRRNETWTMGVTQFSDLTMEEFISVALRPLGALEPLAVSRAVPHVDIDWRKQGAVTPVKNQGASGAAPAFAVAASLESYRKIKGGPLDNLDPSPLAQKVGPHALPVAYFKYILEHPETIPFKISNYKAGANEGDLLTGVTANPTTVVVDASRWQQYKSGVFTGPCGTQVNHAAVVVGANDQAWIIKNSWSTVWGESGYIRIARGQNLCAIGTQPAWPL